MPSPPPPPLVPACACAVQSLRLAFSAGMTQRTVHVLLPVVPTKFCAPLPGLPGPAFFEKWNALAGGAHEAQLVVGLRDKPQSMALFNELTSKGLKLAVLQVRRPAPSRPFAPSGAHRLAVTPGRSQPNPAMPCHALQMWLTRPAHSLPPPLPSPRACARRSQGVDPSPTNLVGIGCVCLKGRQQADCPGIALRIEINVQARARPVRPRRALRAACVSRRPLPSAARPVCAAAAQAAQARVTVRSPLQPMSALVLRQVAETIGKQGQ